MKKITSKCFSFLAVAFILFGLTSSAGATSVLLSEGRNYYAHYTDPSWSSMKAILDTATSNSVTVVYDFSNLAQMMNYDALWVDQRQNESLAPTEISNIQSFLTTGKKVVMIGENDNWTNWNISLIEGVAGGTYNGGFYYGPVYPVVANALTQGVNEVNYVSGANVSGGTALFDYNGATLWGCNLLTVLESNLFTDTYIGSADNTQFATNIANWVADSPCGVVPEPASMFLFGSGILGLFVNKKRKK